MRIYYVTSHSRIGFSTTTAIRMNSSRGAISHVNIRGDVSVSISVLLLSLLFLGDS